MAIDAGEQPVHQEKQLKEVKELPEIAPNNKVGPNLHEIAFRLEQMIGETNYMSRDDIEPEGDLTAEQKIDNTRGHVAGDIKHIEDQIVQIKKRLQFN